jgi:hypothetical protein
LFFGFFTSNKKNVDVIALLEVLVCRTAQEMKKLIKTYEQMYGSQLEKMMESSNLGKIKTFFIALIQGPENGFCSIELDAYLLFSAAQGKKWNTRVDVDVFCIILGMRSSHHLKEVFARYHYTYGKTIDNVIESHFKGDSKNVFLNFGNI